MRRGFPFPAQNRLSFALAPHPLAAAANKLRGRLPLPAGAGNKKSPEETKGGGTACLTLSEHCDIPPPNVRVWRNW